MPNRIGRLQELASVASLRAVPGLINFASLIVVSVSLSVHDFGLYSTLLVTLNFISSLIFGSLQFSLVSRYATLKSDGLQKVYESTILCTATAIAVACIAVSAVYSTLVSDIYLESFIVIAFGLMHCFQELLRVQMHHHRYAVSAVVQSGAFFLLCYFFLSGDSNFKEALGMQAASYMMGAVVSLFYAKIHLQRPRFVLISNIRSVGFPYLVSVVAENCVALGFRYALLWFGAANYLGVFSFCVDLAQRTVGFVVSLAGFIFVPRAFHNYESKGSAAFDSELIHGARLSSVMAGLVMVLIVMLSMFLDEYSPIKESFDPWVFVGVALAVIVNRTKKIVIDPFAMRSSSVYTLSYGYLIGAITSVPLVMIFCAQDQYYLISFIYLAGYVAVFWSSKKFVSFSANLR